MSAIMSFDNKTLKMSNDRIQKMLSGDKEAATKLSSFDKFRDFFCINKRQDALNCLFDLLHSNQGESLHIFNALSQMALPNNSPLFTVCLQGNQAKYCIDGYTVKEETVSDSTKQLIMNQLGAKLGDYRKEGPVGFFDSCKINTDQAMKTLTDKDFSGGGVNKTFNGRAGVLRAENQTAKDDFTRETKLKEYAQDKPSLLHYISTQEKFEQPPSPDLRTDRTYAKVTLYDPQKIESKELDVCLEGLNHEQSVSLVIQSVDMLKSFYLNEVSHCDLHMHNLLVHKLKDDDKGLVYLKAIDFGLVQHGDSFEKYKFNDINYLFFKEGNSFGETIGRNYFARKGSDVDKKHYPLHKLMERFNQKSADLDNILANIGHQLKSGLEVAGNDKDKVNQAFDFAAESLLAVFNRVA